MKVYLETHRMILREFTYLDIDNLVDLDSDPEVTRFINGGKPTARDVIVEQVIPRIMQYYQELDRQGIWAAMDKRDGACMGWFHLRPNRANPAETELGYRLKRKYWGQGFATEGSLQLIRKAFEELQVPVVVAIADPANGASRRVMEKTGLRFMEAYPETDDFIVVKYALSQQDYLGASRER